MPPWTCRIATLSSLVCLVNLIKLDYEVTRVHVSVVSQSIMKIYWLFSFDCFEYVFNLRYKLQVV